MQNPDARLVTLEDDELVRFSQLGSGEAFAELIRRHQSQCFKLAFSILRDRSDAEDEVQNALWKAFEHIVYTPAAASPAKTAASLPRGSLSARRSLSAGIGRLCSAIASRTCSAGTAARLK